MRWIELGRRLGAIVRHSAWNGTAGLFREDAEAKDPRFSQHVQAAAINAGVATDAQVQRILPRLCADRGVLRARSMQAFYVSRALERVSAFGDWHTHILEPWRTFLAQHLTTWPEYPDPARSDSHAWSAWPAIDYVTTVLGVRPLAPGWPGVRLFPQTAGLDWAKGIAPSPAGLIQVEWRKRGRNVSYRAEVPRGFPAEFMVAGQQPKRFPDGGEFEVEFTV